MQAEALFMQYATEAPHEPPPRFCRVEEYLTAAVRLHSYTLRHPYPMTACCVQFLPRATPPMLPIL